MRLLLIANVKAQTVTPRKVRFMHRALASQADVELVHTKRRGHGTELARRAVDEGYDVVVVLGGDGTVNEAANALVGTPIPVAIIPGGGTNVLARALGIPRDPVRAAGHLLAVMREPPRRIWVGRADDRYFAFTCGLGLDGAIVRRVERRQLLKKTAGHGYYVWSGFAAALSDYDRRTPLATVRWGDELEHERRGLFLAISQNGRPFTYLLSRPMHLCPMARFDRGLDLIGIESFRIPFLLRMVVRSFGSRRHIRDHRVLHLHDQRRIEIACDRPLPAQMDGEYLGLRDRLSLEAVPDALSVLA